MARLVKFLLASALIAGATPALADQCDYLGNFATEAAAQADPVWGAYYIPADAQGDPGGWRGDVVIPNALVYTITGYTAVTDPTTGIVSQVPTIVYQPGWFLVVSLPCAGAVLNPALAASPNLMLAADRDRATPNAPMSAFVLYPTGAALAGLVAAQLEIAPTFAGSGYPFNSGQ